MISFSSRLAAASFSLLLSLACSDEETFPVSPPGARPAGGASGSSSGAGGSAGAAGLGGAAGVAGVAGSGGAAGVAGAGAGGTEVSGGSGQSGEAGAAGQGGAGAGGGSGGCEVGASAEQSLGPDGGTLTLCGLTLTVPPGAVSEVATFGAAIVLPAGTLPAFQTFLGPTYRLTSSATSLAAPATVAVVRDPAITGIVQLGVWDPLESAWFTPETCPKNGALTWATAQLGDFALLRDPTVYPPSTSGLGSASLSLDFLGQTSHWNAEDEGGYVIDEVGGGGVRMVLRRPVDGGLEQLEVLFGHEAGKDPELLSVTWLSTVEGVGGWGWLQPVHGPADGFTLTAQASGELDGALTVTTHQGEATQVLAATFTATAEAFRFPPSSSCGLPEGDARP